MWQTRILIFFVLNWIIHSGRLITNEIKKQESPQLVEVTLSSFLFYSKLKSMRTVSQWEELTVAIIYHIPHPKLVSLVSVHVDFLHAAFKYVLPFFHGHLAICGYTVIIGYHIRRHVTLCSVFLVFWQVKSPKFCML